MSEDVRDSEDTVERACWESGRKKGADKSEGGGGVKSQRLMPFDSDSFDGSCQFSGYGFLHHYFMASWGSCGGRKRELFFV